MRRQSLDKQQTERGFTAKEANMYGGGMGMDDYNNMNAPGSGGDNLNSPRNFSLTPLPIDTPVKPYVDYHVPDVAAIQLPPIASVTDKSLERQILSGVWTESGSESTGLKNTYDSQYIPREEINRDSASIRDSVSSTSMPRAVPIAAAVAFNNQVQQMQHQQHNTGYGYAEERDSYQSADEDKYYQVPSPRFSTISAMNRALADANADYAGTPDSLGRSSKYDSILDPRNEDLFAGRFDSMYTDGGLLTASSSNTHGTLDYPTTSNLTTTNPTTPPLHHNNTSSTTTTTTTTTTTHPHPDDPEDYYYDEEDYYDDAYSLGARESFASEYEPIPYNALPKQHTPNRKRTNN
ncbi:hypothetical protein HK102_010864, partial [Quaeritorhiza haematococci]